jgi:hypothetical protein
MDIFCGKCVATLTHKQLLFSGTKKIKDLVGHFNYLLHPFVFIFGEPRLRSCATSVKTP